MHRVVPPRRASRRPSASMVVAFVALLVALGGTSYAAFKLPSNSVGSKQIKKGAVTLTKISRAARKAIAGKPGPAGRPGTPGLNGVGGPPGPSGSPGSGLLAGSFTDVNGVLPNSMFNGTEFYVLAPSGHSRWPEDAVIHSQEPRRSAFSPDRPLVARHLACHATTPPPGTNDAVRVFLKVIIGAQSRQLDCRVSQGQTSGVASGELAVPPQTPFYVEVEQDTNSFAVNGGWNPGVVSWGFTMEPAS